MPDRRDAGRWCVVALGAAAIAAAGRAEGPAALRLLEPLAPGAPTAERDVQVAPGVAERLALHATLQVDLGAGEAVTALLTAERRRAAWSWWTGPLVDDGGWLAVATAGDVVTAVMQRNDGRTYRLRPRPGGGSVLAAVDPAALPPCGTTEAATGGPSEGVPQDFDTAAGIGHYCGDADTVIDVMVVYTTAAREGQGGFHGIQALIGLAEASTNLAFANSGLETRMNVVLTYEPKYEETGNSTADLHYLTDVDDDVLDEIHLFRDQVGADVVSLLVDSFGGTVCGEAFYSIGTGNQPLPHLGFNVVRASCAVDNLTFAHELGHNFGCRHNREFDNSPGAFPYSHGYLLDDPVGTVMAVLPVGIQRVPHFSNPEIEYDGIPTGVKPEDPESAHNARSIRLTAFNLANFRCSDCNLNDLPDSEDVALGRSVDCNRNAVPDECDLVAGVLSDCDGDGRGDECALAEGTAFDCNINGRLDRCDIAAGLSFDLDDNGVPDECEDCNDNDLPDGIDIAVGASEDCNGDGRPDECDLADEDCNANGVLDACDIDAGTSLDLDLNGLPDECEDCNGNGLPDGLELAIGTSVDCDGNDLPDECDIAEGRLSDADGDGLADECAAIRNDTAGTQHLSIQLAVDGASAGDVITVQPGVYNETVDLLGKPLTLRSAAGAVQTIINGAGAVDPVLRCASGEGPDTLIHGFTILGGANAGWLVVGSSPIAVGCIIAGNVAQTTGGGLRCLDASPTLVSCVIRDNAASLGGGIYAFAGSPRLIACTLAGNSAGVVAGAIGAFGGSQPWLNGCIVWNNGATPILGAGILLRYSDVEGGWRGAGVENIDADPLFVDPTVGDLRLAAGSPCIDAGDNAPLPPWAPLDAAAAPRVVDDPLTPDTGNPDGHGAIVDMGALEHQPPAGR